MVEEKETEFVESQNVIITKVTIETPPEQVNQVKRIRFVTTEKGDITWKPKKKSSKYIEGMEILFDELFTLDDIPQKVKDIAKATMTTGKCIAKVNYTLMTTKPKEGEPKEYRFINAESMLDKWEVQVLENPTTQENITS